MTAEESDECQCASCAMWRQIARECEADIEAREAQDERPRVPRYRLDE